MEQIKIGKQAKRFWVRATGAVHCDGCGCATWVFRVIFTLSDQKGYTKCSTKLLTQVKVTRICILIFITKDKSENLFEKIFKYINFYCREFHETKSRQRQTDWYSQWVFIGYLQLVFTPYPTGTSICLSLLFLIFFAQFRCVTVHGVIATIVCVQVNNQWAMQQPLPSYPH